MTRVCAVWPALLCLSLAGGGAGCGLLRKRPVPRDDGVVREMMDGRRPIGQITMLDREHEFVLFRSPLAEALKDDTLLVAKDRAGNTTGKLRVSPEKKRGFVAADIAEGSPNTGDVVFVPSDKKPVSSSPPPEAGKLSTPAGPAAPGTWDQPGATNQEPGTGTLPEALPPLGQPSGPPEVFPDPEDPTGPLR